MTAVREQARLTSRGLATRARLVEAAADMFFERGVGGTSLDEILAATGTSKSQLYHYFTGKDDLVRAVIARQTDRVLDAQRPCLERLNSMAGLRRWRDRLVSLQGQRGCVGGCPIGSLASQLVETNPGARQDLTASFTRWEAYLVEGLTDMRSRGRLRPDADPHALAEQVMTAVQGGLLLAQIRRSTRPLELALDMALAHVDSHLAGRPRAPASAQER